MQAAQNLSALSGRPSRRGSAGPRPGLAGAQVLIVDHDRPTTILLRDRLEQDHGASVEIAGDYENALDVLGNASRPVALVMLDPSTGPMLADSLMVLLCRHRAGIAVTLHGQTPPEKLPFPGNFVGAAAYTHLATSGQAAAQAETVLAGGLTVRAIVDSRIIPATLDWTSAIAIYGADPGLPFPLTVRT